MKSATEKRVKELEARISMLEIRIAELEATSPGQIKIYPNPPDGTSPFPFPNIWYTATSS